MAVELWSPKLRIFSGLVIGKLILLQTIWPWLDYSSCVSTGGKWEETKEKKVAKLVRLDTEFIIP